tara:strand:- start:1001 stop:1393 length:393 start_codon:yes stop_codon:yes gene_type:complete
MGDLYDWCIDKRKEHSELNLNCEHPELKPKSSTLTDSVELELSRMVTKSLYEMNDQNTIKDKIAIKRKQVSDIKQLLETKNYLTHERRHQELQKISKTYYEKMIMMIVLLVVAILMAVVLIYYFFIFRKK